MKRNCLKCNRRFLAKGWTNRVCPRCHATAMPSGADRIDWSMSWTRKRYKTPTQQRLEYLYGDGIE